jgi:hypothetical protein
VARKYAQNLNADFVVGGRHINAPGSGETSSQLIARSGSLSCRDRDDILFAATVSQHDSTTVNREATCWHGR